MSDADTIRRLRAELDEANETIRQLRLLLKTADPLPAWVPLPLTGTEEALMRVLLARDLVTLAVFNTVVPNRAGECAVDDNRLKVYVVRLRKKLAAAGVRIVTLWGRGYALDRASVEEAAARVARFANHHSAVQGEGLAA